MQDVKKPDKPTLVEALRHEEGFRVVRFAGERYYWYLSGLGIRKAKAEGYRPLRLLSDIASMGYKLSQKKRVKIDEDELLIHYGVLFYAATSAFYDHTLDSVLARMTFKRLSEIQPIVMEEILAMASAATDEEVEVEDGAEGNLAMTP